MLYVTHGLGCSVSASHVDPETGTLSGFQTIPTLPQDYTGRNSCAQSQLSPSGKFLFAPNRGNNSIACFSVDSATGELTAIDRVPTEPIPRVIAVDPEGKYFFAAGLESGRLAVYRIVDTSGLDHVETYDVGKAPMWVSVIVLVG